MMLSKKESIEINKIVDKKCNINEVIDALMKLRATCVCTERKWWEKIMKKHNLEIKGSRYTLNWNKTIIIKES